MLHLSERHFYCNISYTPQLETQLIPDSITFTNPSVTLNLPGVEWIRLGINDKDRPPSLHTPALYCTAAMLACLLRYRLNYSWGENTFRPASGLAEILIHRSWRHHSNTTLSPQYTGAVPVILYHILQLTCKKSPDGYVVLKSLYICFTLFSHGSLV